MIGYYKLASCEISSWLNFVDVYCWVLRRVLLLYKTKSRTLGLNSIPEPVKSRFGVVLRMRGSNCCTTCNLTA